MNGKQCSLCHRPMTEFACHDAIEKSTVLIQAAILTSLDTFFSVKEKYPISFTPLGAGGDEPTVPSILEDHGICRCCGEKLVESPGGLSCRCSREGPDTTGAGVPVRPIA